MRKLLLPLLVLLLLTGCSTRQVNFDTELHLKAFEEEDTYIFQALYAERAQQYEEAAKLYMTLYERSGKREYLYHSLQMHHLSREYDSVIAKVRTLLKKEPGNPTLMRFEIMALLEKKEYEAAKERALVLVSKEKMAKNYMLVSGIYITQKRYDMALRHLERAYAIDYDENILDKMAIVLFVNLGEKEKAIGHLESHSMTHGCSEVICRRLAGFYSEQNDIEGMLSVYTRLYEMTSNKVYAHSIIKIYNYKKDFTNLMIFLEKSGADDPLLLNLYINTKTYDKAAALAKTLYEREGDIYYLGQHAIFTYESAPDKNDRTMLLDVMEKMKKVLLQSDDALFQNYLGYLMIDHDLGIEEGLEYVKEALKSEPDSPYYLDSMAWGLYKLGECDEAYGLIIRVKGELGSEDKEVQSHLEAIKKCMKGTIEK